MSSPLISIIIPVYNGALYLRQAIESALAQSYAQKEVIVVDDGSTDQSWQIIQSYGAKIRALRQKNGGVSTALNLGIKNAKGEYISWLSHDDVYHPDKLRRQVQAINQLPRDRQKRTIIFSNYKIIDQNSEVIEVPAIEKVHDLRKFVCPLYPVMKGLIFGCTLLIPKLCFVESGYFDPALRTSQDYDLWFKFFHKYPVYFQTDYLLLSRRHPGQGTFSQRATDESNALWLKMLQQISDQDKIAIDGSLQNFYLQNYLQMRRVGFLKAADYSFTKLSYLNQLRAPILFYGRKVWARLKPLLAEILRIFGILK
jgi:glycosyltransferase involved in cell wall biosynthesis